MAVPPKVDPSRPCGVLLDPGHGTGAKLDQAGKADLLGMYVRHAKEAGLGDWLVVRTEIIEQVGAGGLAGDWPEERITPLFEACLRDLATRWPVDPDRLIVAGLSQTGFWAWELGAAHPGRWLGIAPMSAVTWQVRKRLDALRTTPVWVAHGDADRTCPVGQPRATCARLERDGATVTYVEVPGAGHEYAVWSHLPAGLKELTSRPRERHPRSISFAVQTLRQAWCHWLRLEAIDTEGTGKAGADWAAAIDAEIDGNRVTLASSGVQRVRVTLGPELVDLAQPVTVTWNGTVVHDGPVAPSFAALLANAAETADWAAACPVSLLLDAPK